jgi:hypothetical protein
MLDRARTLAHHLRRYPWWYGLAAVWIVGMLALPIVRGTALADAFGGETGSTTAPPATAAPAGPELAGGGGPPASTPGITPVDEAGNGDDGSTTTTAAAADDDGGDALQLVPPELLDAIFDVLPPLVFPALPPEVAPVANAVVPLMSTGCSGLGLASVVVAVAAQSIDGVPFDRLLPYLAPVSTACASFPVPKAHTVCEGDKPLIIDLAGLTSTPPVLGLGIDQLRAFEQLMTSQFGMTVPAVSDQLSTQLHCTLVS